jgi:hypothetical protein
VGLAVVTAAALSALLAWDPRVAAQIVSEDQTIEWLQVALLAGAAGFCLVAATRRPPALDILLVLMFAGMIELELDLDRRIFGVPVIDTRFLMSPAVPLGIRLLVILVLAGLAVAVLAYAWRRREDLWREARIMAREPWGRLLLAGGLLLGLVQLFESRLNALLPLPRYFLEESLELLAVLYCFVALAWRARHVKTGGPDAPGSRSRPGGVSG